MSVYNVRLTKKFETRGEGVVSFTTSSIRLAHKILMLRSNFDLVDGQYVGCCIAVQTFRKFARV